MTIHILDVAVFFMKIKKWEAAVIIGFAIALAFAAPLSVQSSLADKMTRLHVVANSDSEEDQLLKLKVRDAVLKASEGHTVLSEALLDDMQAAAQQCVYDNGRSYPVTVERGEMWFDTRDYDGFSLAAGNYDSVKVRIGDAAGKNWWCVIFPPLCAAVSEKQLEQTAVRAGLSSRELAFISKDGNVCVLGFKLAELWGKLKKPLEKRK